MHELIPVETITLVIAILSMVLYLVGLTALIGIEGHLKRIARSYKEVIEAQQTIARELCRVNGAQSTQQANWEAGSSSWR